jgi:hypothetical protein
MKLDNNFFVCFVFTRLDYDEDDPLNESFCFGKFNYGMEIDAHLFRLQNLISCATTATRCRFVERREIKIDELNDDGNQLKAMFARITLCPAQVDRCFKNYR